jgi:pimeloyl-ACP methyl ester carboxylesterase
MFKLPHMHTFSDQRLRACIFGLWAAFIGQSGLCAQSASYGPELQGFEYPFAVSGYRFSSQNVDLNMAYMDVKPEKPNGKVVVLFHGKNFCAASWQTTIGFLLRTGYRVIAPDQVGFCKSTKPRHYQFSFQQLAGNTRELLQSLGIAKATFMGHSTGGMLAIRYALMYPGDVEQLVLVDPIGLEDWKAKGVPWHSVDAWYKQELETSLDSVRAYEQKTYYVGSWLPDYEKWAQMYAGMFSGPGRDLVAWNSALLYDMIYTQPVYYELGDLVPQVLLIIGDKDTTAIGKAFSPPAVQARIGHYPILAKEAAARIPHVKLTEFAQLGHAPWIQDPEQFQSALQAGLLPVQ